MVTNDDRINEDIADMYLDRAEGIRCIAEYSRVNGSALMSEEMTNHYKGLMKNRALLELGAIPEVLFMTSNLVLFDRMFSIFLSDLNMGFKEQKVSMFSKTSDMMEFMAENFDDKDADAFNDLIDSLDDDPMSFAESEEVMFNAASDFLLSKMIDTDRVQV